MANIPKYTDPDTLQAKVDEYFELCEGKVVTDGYGMPMLDKYGNPIVINQRPLTVAGLAYHLGFKSLHSIYDYKGKKQYQDIITRALFRIQVYTAERLFDKEGCNGAKFSLQNNFKQDWADKSAEDDSGKEIILVELTRKQKGETEGA